MQHILTLDDDPQIGSMLAEYLGENGFRVSVANSGEHMLKVIQGDDPVDLILLDVNLPQVDGLTWARRIRAENERISIIMLTGRDSEIDRVVGLELGADDYISKPFNLRELLARIKAVLRRSNVNITEQYSKVSFAGWELNVEARRLVSPVGEKVILTNTEFNLLMAFIEHPNRVLSRDQLLEYSRRRADEVFDRAIDYSIMQLRRKLETDPKKPQLIKTERSAGYMFTVEVVVH